MDRSVTDADKRIWDIPSGTLLTCAKSLVMECNGLVAFTVGKTYEVVSMHPIAEPAFIRMLNDHSESHRLDGADVAEYFGRN